MFHHVRDDAAHAVVGGDVKHLLATLASRQEARGAQHAQMMAHQGRGQADAISDITDAQRFAQASDGDAETVRIAQHSENLSEFNRLLLVQSDLGHIIPSNVITSV